jgi:hypothetical protein
MLNVIMLSVIMLKVKAPLNEVNER